jgi:alcohol dehydrogenase
MPYVLEYNQSVNGDKIAELLLPLAGAEVYASTPQSQRATKAIQHIREVRDVLFERTKLPRTLEETGKVTEAQLEDIATKALDDGSIIFNPREASKADLKAILQKAWA